MAAVQNVTIPLVRIHRGVKNSVVLHTAGGQAGPDGIGVPQDRPGRKGRVSRPAAGLRWPVAPSTRSARSPRLRSGQAGSAPKRRDAKSAHPGRMLTSDRGLKAGGTPPDCARDTASWSDAVLWPLDCARDTTSWSDECSGPSTSLGTPHPSRMNALAPRLRSGHHILVG